MLDIMVHDPDLRRPTGGGGRAAAAEPPLCICCTNTVVFAPVVGCPQLVRIQTVFVQQKRARRLAVFGRDEGQRIEEVL